MPKMRWIHCSIILKFQRGSNINTTQIISENQKKAFNSLYKVIIILIPKEDQNMIKIKFIGWSYG